MTTGYSDTLPCCVGGELDGDSVGDSNRNLSTQTVRSSLVRPLGMADRRRQLVNLPMAWSLLERIDPSFLPRRRPGVEEARLSEAVARL
jgi:hypothetical protein